ncbi:molecular chaperone HtpG [Paenibacillus larvae]|uniref:Chaperone protein HtpG n=3 Tax=Paenibacillus larvae TaxID=1464 RepID=V9W459_9BACL|nr:molecular chaperone HtpG [Paenibacillus larvae]AHD04744.1 chaperone protein HtpG [Paenibacillus larvae subsp. larvae DSM 25430]AQR78203.1 molecular chaperone HtpG [Paenibacillus larvae subsp. larvae]AQT84448.1 molecular chaperone HtpG [Paenibacillus larvae subsp. pulvifaciens]AQZ46445.1 molecular chaperone HtpG [Paenibacillus larvae subsp. pulvifaciens]AVF20599.1 chaperone protein HtpG [Paenibacillus larvae subsp. larvae]
MAKKQFKAESKRLLEMMINSIYTQKEIFLRELISNASDAIDKIYYKALTDEQLVFNKEDYYIKVAADKPGRTLTISDTGIGMTKEELEHNLGVIAKSGSLTFKNENEQKDGHNIIGQFGVGFYSAFMVADVVTVISKALGSDEAFKWESKGADGYTIVPWEKDSVGTEIILKMKQNTEEEQYDEFLEEYRLKAIIKKYSDFIRYPIKMDVKGQRPKEDDENELEEYQEEQTINSMVPIWRKNKSELTAEDYENFYTEKRYGFDKPLKHIHISADGSVVYNAILFIPENTPFDYYTKEYEKGLELYSNGVLIMNKCPDLLPDYFSFVKGMVDSEDLSLNISREMLQHDRQLSLIAKNIKNKIKSQLQSLLKDEREKYEKFYNSFGRQLKYGVYSDYGMNKEVLQDLLLFHSSKEKKLVTLDEYVSRMPEDQKYIYYASGESIDRIEKLPQTELVADKGYEILYFTDDIDEFAIKMLMKYKEKEFKSVSSGDLGIEPDENEKESGAEENDNKDLFEAMKNILADKVKNVRASKRLKSHPVCLSTEGEVTIEMEKILNAMPNNQEVKADKVLEINIHHEVFQSLKDAYEKDKEKLNLYTNLLYNQALLIEGLPVSDPVEFTNDICKVMVS